MVNRETKDNIVTEASAHFKLEDQILVFQDGREVPDNFNIPSYTLKKKIRLPSRARASERLYLLHASEKKGICSNIYNIVNFFTNKTYCKFLCNFWGDLQCFDDKMDNFVFHIVNFRHIWTFTTNEE